MKLKKLEKLRSVLRSYEDTLRKYEKLFMADGQIDKKEQKKLDRLNVSIRDIINKINAKEEELSSDERTKNALKANEEAKADWSSTEDDIADDKLMDEVSDNGSGISASVGKKGHNNKVDVSIVQNLLKEKNNAPLKGSGICGPKTIKSIKEFQTKVGISESGIIAPDDETWKKLNEASSSSSSEEEPIDKKDLSIKKPVGKKAANDKEDVKIVQKLLKEKGARLVGLGVCGPLTISSIKKFQEINMNGFSDGVIDPDGRTWKLLVGNGKPIRGGDEDNNDNGGDSGPLEKPNWIKIAEGEKGVKENTSKTKHDPRVMEYHGSVGGNINTDETPWCSSFVNWVMKKAGKGGTNSAMAISWKKYGEKLDRPAYGAIAVIDWDGPGPGWKGHVGFVVGKKGNSILMLGGNQANAVNVKSFPKSKIVAYVVPSGYDVPDSAYSFGESTGEYGSGGDVSSTR